MNMNAHPNINAPQPGGDMGNKTKKAIFIILALLLLLLLFFLNTQDSGGGEFVELTGDGKNKTGQSNEPQQPEGKGEGEAGGEAEQEDPKEGGDVPTELPTMPFTINIGKPKPATPTPKIKAPPSTTPGSQKTASPGKGGGGEIERRLAGAGAQTGQIQISLAWDSSDDLDLHVLDPNNEKIWYSHKRSRSGGVLDVDMNARAITLRPVENVFWANGRAPRGKFRVKVVCYKYRGRNGTKVPFRVRMKIDGRVLPIWSGFVNARNGSTVYVHDFTR
jgi:hypothetical protein